VLNLGEGRKFNNGNRGKHYDIAQGSANEVKAALDTAEAWGWLETNEELRVLLDRLARAAVEAHALAQGARTRIARLTPSPYADPTASTRPVP
jgi:hypothetical protein